VPNLEVAAVAPELLDDAAIRGAYPPVRKLVVRDLIEE
jgi:hypothetical protein